MTHISILNNGEWALDEEINPEGESYSISKALPKQPSGEANGIVMTFGESIYAMSTENRELTLVEEYGVVEEFYGSGWCKRASDFYYKDSLSEETVTFPVGIDSDELIDIGWSSNYGYVILQRGDSNKLIWCASDGTISHQETISNGTPIIFGWTGYDIYVITTTHNLKYDDSTQTLSELTAITTTQQAAMDNEIFNEDTTSLNEQNLIFLGWTNYLYAFYTYNNWYYIKDESGTRSLEIWEPSESGYVLASDNELPNQTDSPYQLVIYNDWNDNIDITLWYENEFYSYGFDDDSQEWIITNHKPVNCDEILSDLCYIDGSVGKSVSDYGEIQSLDEDISDFIRMTPNSLIFNNRAQSAISTDFRTFNFGELIDEEDIIDISVMQWEGTAIILTATNVIYVFENVILDQKSIVGNGTPLFLSEDNYIFTTTSILKYDIYSEGYPLTVEEALPAPPAMLTGIDDGVFLSPDILDGLNLFEGALMAIKDHFGFVYVLNETEIAIWDYDYDLQEWIEETTITLPKENPIGIEIPINIMPA